MGPCRHVRQQLSRGPSIHRPRNKDPISMSRTFIYLYHKGSFKQHYLYLVFQQIPLHTFLLIVDFAIIFLVDS